LKRLRQAFSSDALPEGLKRLTVEHRRELAKSSRERYLKERINSDKRVVLDVGEVGMIDVGRIRPRYDQPRTTSFNLSSIFDLAKSRKKRQVASIIIRPIEDDPEGFDFELIDGERRYISALIARVSLIKAERELEEKISDKDAYLTSAIANFCHEEHSPLEALDMIKRIMKDHKIGVTEAAETLGKSGSWGIQHERLGNLEISIRKMLEEEKISMTTAAELGKYPKEFQVKVLEDIIRERMTAAAAKMHIRCELKKEGLPIKRGKRGRQPSDDYEIMKVFIKGSIIKADGLLKMGGDALKSMFAHRDARDKEIVLAELDSLIGRIEDIKETIK
jgi:ParB/RepB/Spo0J family partition protein